MIEFRQTGEGEPLDGKTGGGRAGALGRVVKWWGEGCTLESRNRLPNRLVELIQSYGGMRELRGEEGAGLAGVPQVEGGMSGQLRGSGASGTNHDFPSPAALHGPIFNTSRGERRGQWLPVGERGIDGPVIHYAGGASGVGGGLGGGSGFKAAGIGEGISRRKDKKRKVQFKKPDKEMEKTKKKSEDGKASNDQRASGSARYKKESQKPKIKAKDQQ
ncbi:hypothetical protein Tco_0836730 [Tanacetum coccineum]